MAQVRCWLRLRLLTEYSPEPKLTCGSDDMVCRVYPSPASPHPYTESSIVPNAPTEPTLLPQPAHVESAGNQESAGCALLPLPAPRQARGGGRSYT